MERRKFIKKTCAFIGVGIIGPSLLLESCKKKNVSPSGPTVNFDIDLSTTTYQSLNTVGNYKYKNGIIIANTSGGFIALAKACTHEGCSVSYSQSSNHFPCPCHGASFSNSGSVLGGPTNTPLKKYTVTKNGNILTISG